MVTTHEYYIKNKKRIAKYNKKWMADHPEKRYLWGKKWRESNKEKHIESLKKWRKENPDKVHKQNIKWYQEHKDAAISRSHNWYKNNKKRASIRTNNYYKKRAATDIKFRLLINIRSRINKLFKNKSLKTKEILGYSIEDLQYHLEQQFKDGMSWENYGKWHIDHIKPLSKIIINGTDDEIRNAYRLNNLQPLWALDNLKKGSK